MIHSHIFLNILYTTLSPLRSISRSLSRGRELLLCLVHLLLVSDKGLLNSFEICWISTLRVNPNLPFHKIAWQQNADLAFVDVKAVGVMVLLKEVNAVNRIFALHAVVDLHVVNNNVIRLQATGNSVVPLT